MQHSINPMDRALRAYSNALAAIEALKWAVPHRQATCLRLSGDLLLGLRVLERLGEELAGQGST